MGNTQVTSLHPVQVAGDPKAPLIIRNESSKTIYYRANPFVSSATNDGNLTEHQEVEVIQPTWLVTEKQEDGEVRVFPGNVTLASTVQVGTANYAADSVTEPKIGPEAIDEDSILAAVKRLFLGTTVSEAVKTETEAAAETGVEPSATKAALVTLSFVGKAEATSVTVEANGVAVYKYKGTPAAADEVLLGTYLVLPGKLIKTKKGSGTVTNVLFSVQLMN